MNIHSVQEPTYRHIARIANASQINEIKEVKKMVSFLSHLIETLMFQITSGMLSGQASKLKVLQLFGVIQHSQVGHHPLLKSQLLKLKNIFESKFKQKLNTPDWKQTHASNKTLPLHKIEHYVTSILDSESNAIYNDAPKSLIDIVRQTIKPKEDPAPQKQNESPTKNKKTVKEKAEKQTYLSHCLSTLIEKRINLHKIKTHVHQTKQIKKQKKHPQRIEFDTLRLQLNQSIKETA